MICKLLPFGVADQRRDRHDFNAALLDLIGPFGNCIDGHRKGRAGADGAAIGTRSPFQLVKAVEDRAALLRRIDQNIRRRERHHIASCNPVSLTARRGAVIEIIQAALSDLAQHRREGFGLGCKTRAHIIHHTGIIGHPRQRPQQGSPVLAGTIIHRQRIATGIDARIVERLHRQLQHKFMTVLPGRLHPALQTVALRRKSERDFRRKLVDCLHAAGL